MTRRKKINIAVAFLLFIFAVARATEANSMISLKKEVVAHIDTMQETLERTARQVWEFAEIAMEEYRSSALLADMLAEQGFVVQRGAAGMPVAFVATYGEGHPIFGILAEYDALPGLSQKAGSPGKEALVPGAAGHGCGHNIFGTASVGAAVAIKKIMAKYKLTGTLKLFGCPAEETVEGKIYMAREGIFNGLDICFDWHPGDENEVSLETSNALNNFEVMFYGHTAHAAGDPWNGCSALDAVELMNHGVNYLREHVKPTVRLHYVIPDAGLAPNVVPDYARVWYYVRGKDRTEVEDAYARVLKIAEGAALMTGTRHEVHLITGVYNYLKNREVARLLYKNLKWVGAPQFSKEEQEFAGKMQRSLGNKEEGLSTTLSTTIKPFKEPAGYWGGGSTDAADVSWITPTASLNTACCPLNIPGHSWCIVASVGSSVGFKGMLTAAKVLAASAVEVLLDSSIVKRAQAEFKEKTKDFVYKCAIPAGQKPRIKPPLTDNR